MDEEEFNRFANGWNRSAGLSKERVRQLCDATEKRVDARQSKAFKICKGNKACQNTDVMSRYEARQDKINRAKQSANLCRIECVGWDEKARRESCVAECTEYWVEKMIGYRYADRRAKQQFPGLFKQY